METQKSPFNRILLIILVVLYLVTITAVSYLGWADDPAGTQWWMILLNFLILSVPLVLLFGSIYLLALAWQEHAAGRQISPRLAKIIHWAPRIAAILIILFVGLFSLDVFGNGAPPLEVLVAFLIHNIPSIFMLILLIFAWKRPAVGVGAFVAAAVMIVIISMRAGIYLLTNILFFVLPMLLVAGLFYADWKWLQPQAPAQGGAAV
jgi:hypothetical protein